MTPETMENLLEFCMGKITDEDLMTLEEMLAKQVPAKEIAADAAIKRRVKLAMDCQARGYRVQRKRAAQAIVADRDIILGLHPDMFRLSDPSKIGAVPTGSVKPRTKPHRMTETEVAASEKAFPHMFRKH